jgi:hypothetical protein
MLPFLSTANVPWLASANARLAVPTAVFVVAAGSGVAAKGAPVVR